MVLESGDGMANRGGIGGHCAHTCGYIEKQPKEVAP